MEMYCASCKKEVSLTDARCKSCNADLRKMGAITYDRPLQKGGEEYRQAAKKMVMDEVAREAAIHTAGLDSDEKKLLMPIFEQRFKPLLGHYGSDEEYEKVFAEKIIPNLSNLEKDPAIKPFLQEIDRTISEKLGFSIYQHYGNPSTFIEYERKSKKAELSGKDVLQVLRAGELNYKFLEARLPVHSSAAIFPFCRAGEMASWLHACKQYDILSDSRIFREIVNAVRDIKSDFTVQGATELPRWFSRQQGTILEIITAFEFDDKSKNVTINIDSISNSRRVGVATYLFGRTWSMLIGGKTKDNMKFSKLFAIDNPFKISAREEEIEALASSLCDLQGLRNRSAHLDNMETLKDIKEIRELSYFCLSRLPLILPFGTS